MHSFDIRPFMPPDSACVLREQVRTFLAANPPSTDPVRRANSWQRTDPAFSRALGAAGFIGMTWPKRYGGHERHPLETLHRA